MARTVAKKAVKPVAKKAPAKAAPKATKPAAKKAPARAAAKTAAPPAKKITVTAPAGKAITQSALLQIIADHNGWKRVQAKEFVESYTEIVKAHVLKGVKVKLGDLGTIMIRSRKARIGRNPQTGAPVKIKASKKLAFRQSTTMRDSLK